MKFVREIGKSGKIAAASVAAFPFVFRSSDSRADFCAQLYKTGIATLPVVTVVSLFMGMILSLQVGLELRRFNQEIYLGAAVMVTMRSSCSAISASVCAATLPKEGRVAFFRASPVSA